MLGQFDQVYMEDILIFSRTKADHLIHVRMVLETLRHHRLYAKASKCQFGRSSVAFLGHVISARGVAMDPRKLSAISTWARPTSCSDVRRFIGLANYYRRFDRRFSALASPLTSFSSPQASFPWTANAQARCEALPTPLMSSTVLHIQDTGDSHSTHRADILQH